MPYNSLRDFIIFLEQKNQINRVKVPVSPILELTEIQTRLLAESGPAVLFENVVRPNGQRYNFPVLVNLFGTVERVAWGIDRTPDKLREVGEMLAFLKQPEVPRDWRQAAKIIPLLKTVRAMTPKIVSKAHCQEKVHTGVEIDLSVLPIQSCWPGEPAPLITWGVVVTQGPEAATHRVDALNLGIYRLQVTGPNTTLVRWLSHRGGAQQFQRWKKKRGSELFPMAVVIGTDPGTLLAAVTPVPETLSEYQFAGLLRGKNVELVNCLTVPLQVPAQSEIVLEGYVMPEEEAMEGPYGDHTGYYNAVESFPVFRVSAVTHRHDALYLSTFTGRPPDEPSILGEALNEVFIPLLVQQFPEITDFWLPPEGCSYRIAVISIHKAYPGHAKQIMMGIWSFLRQFIYTKFVIIVDNDINARDWKEIVWAIATRVDPVRDITLLERTPIDYLDFASPEVGLGSKLGLDATNKWPPETHRIWGQRIHMTDSIIQMVTRKWLSYGLPGTGRPIWR